MSARRWPALLLACAASAVLGGCGAEPSEPRPGEAAQPADLQQAARSTQPERPAPAAIDFASDSYLEHVCRDELEELPFQRFKSYDFVYESPLPVRVSGAYYEVRGRGAADAHTIYQEVVATIFRDVEMVVEADQTAPHFSFDRWAVPFAVSDHPFLASRQLKHQRAMGSTFPFLDLAEIAFLDPVEARRRDTSGSYFSRNFISALNFLATRGENMWGRNNSFEDRGKASKLRLSTTGTHYEHPLLISDDDLAALKRIPPGENLWVSSLGHYILILIGKPTRFVAAIDDTRDAVGLRACEGHS
jgi:hypothetical protein